MPSTPAIQARVTITAVDVNGNSVAKTFNYVYQLRIDYFKGTINIVDEAQGSFYFSMLTPTTVTYTIAGTTTTVVIS